METEIIETERSVKLMINDKQLVLRFDKVNPDAEIVLTNGAQKTTSAKFYKELERYCNEQGYAVVKNQQIGEYHGHIS